MKPCFTHLLDHPLRIGDALLAQLVRDLADAVLVADTDGIIVFWNESAARAFGWSANEAIG